MSNKLFNPGDKVVLKDDWHVYDFGYCSDIEGKAVIYEPGCKNAQDSYAVSLKDLSIADPSLYERCSHCGR